MATLQARVDALGLAVAAKFNAIKAQLMPAGGALGAVLGKLSAADHDVGWITPTATVNVGALASAAFLDGTEYILTETTAGVQKKVPSSTLFETAFAWISGNSYNLANTTANQKIFNSSANGAVTLASGVYIIDMMLYVLSMSGTSGNISLDLRGAGTAGARAGSSPLINIIGVDNSVTTPAAQNGVTQSVAAFAVAAPIVTAGVGTTLAIRVHMIADITAGTMIPSLALQTAVGTAFVWSGSYIRFQRVAPGSAPFVGNWS